MLPVSPSLTSPGSSPSPCNEGAALLFLPWEILARIVSHLPAQCVIQVLPKVCRLFQSLSEDSTAWQIRARRLIGPNRSFPLGPSEGFDWPTACLEMEQLTRSWTKSEEGIQGAEGERDAQEEDRDGARGEERKEREEGPGIEDGVEDAEARLDDEDERIERFLEELDSDRNPSHSLSRPSGSRDGNVNLWDVRKRVLLRTLGDPGLFSTHRGWVWCLAAHGPLLCSGSFDSTVRLWDLAAGGAERGLIQGRAAVLCLSCQDHVLLAGSYDKNVSIYDTRASDPLVKSLRLHGNAVLCLSADEKYILSGSKDNTLAVFDRRAGKLLQKLRWRRGVGWGQPWQAPHILAAGWLLQACLTFRRGALCPGHRDTPLPWNPLYLFFRPHHQGAPSLWLPEDIIHNPSSVWGSWAQRGGWGARCRLWEHLRGCVESAPVRWPPKSMAVLGPLFSTWSSHY
ncbi:F-box/WD repeat-containing protein 9-like isoform X3 [Scleropages formosus]|uniref:F-box/WD repeat-containing protein 9-like isoform X3 n=1 Tax=Scleropages formosus TaxID=113540 RepID=UPI0010FA921B|nr:F-box/WD repeat-containing protein 9-like isoform X3 [Scleropages formosus]